MNDHFQNFRIYGDKYEADAFPCLPQLLDSPSSNMVLRYTSPYPLKRKKSSRTALVSDTSVNSSTTTSFSGSSKTIYDPCDSLSNLGPIVDIEIRERSDPIPIGYSRVPLTVGQFITDNSNSTGSQQRYLYIKRDPTWTVTPVVSLSVVCLSNSETIPPSYCIVKGSGRTAHDLSRSTKTTRTTYLCIKQCMGNPIMSVLLYQPEKYESLPSDFIPLSRTPGGLDADLHLGPNGPSVRLAYRKRLLSVQVIVAST